MWRTSKRQEDWLKIKLRSYEVMQIKNKKQKNMKRYTSKHPNRYFMNLFLKFALDGCLLVDKDYARGRQEPSFGSLRTIFFESAS